MHASIAARPMASIRASLAGRRVTAKPLRATRRAISVSRIQAALKEGDDMANYSDYFRKLQTDKGDMISISQYKGKKPVVLFFYPKAETPGCTAEVCSFRDRYSAFQKAGAEVIGISGDDRNAQASFSSKHSLPFTLAVDQGNFLRKGFGIPNDMLGLLPGRQTFVIDKQGKCVLSFNSQLDTQGHIDNALKAVEALV
ncbi:unnamed protein product [Pedinophyceae sp. YPF-701]|nr:unnamed protein product [Pedinophyceae sp. YPF-701]